MKKWMTFSMTTFLALQGYAFMQDERVLDTTKNVFAIYKGSDSSGFNYLQIQSGEDSGKVIGGYSLQQIGQLKGCIQEVCVGDIVIDKVLKTQAIVIAVTSDGHYTLRPLGGSQSGKLRSGYVKAQLQIDEDLLPINNERYKKQQTSSGSDQSVKSAQKENSSPSQVSTSQGGSVQGDPQKELPSQPKQESQVPVKSPVVSTKSSSGNPSKETMPLPAKETTTPPVKESVGNKKTHVLQVQPEDLSKMTIYDYLLRRSSPR